MRWAEAVKIWNTHKKTVNPSHVYCLPRKGTPEHAHVKHIQSGGKPDEFHHKIESKPEAKPAPKMEPKKFVVNKERVAAKRRVEEVAQRTKKEKVAAFLKAALERRRAKKAPATDPRPQQFLEALKEIQSNRSLDGRANIKTPSDRLMRDVYDIITSKVYSGNIESDDKFIEEQMRPLVNNVKERWDDYNKYSVKYVSGSVIDKLIESLSTKKGPKPVPKIPAPSPKQPDPTVGKTSRSPLRIRSSEDFKRYMPHIQGGMSRMKESEFWEKFPSGLELWRSAGGKLQARR